jgi:hypothetical protein
MPKNYGMKLETTVRLYHPKGRMKVWPDALNLWYLKRDTRHALFTAPHDSKTHTVIYFVNGFKAKLKTVSTDGLAQFRRVK